jgi:hypothetical protein
VAGDFLAGDGIATVDNGGGEAGEERGEDELRLYIEEWASCRWCFLV